MDWAEDLKLSIRKTGIRKGRRSKNEPFKDNSTTNQQSTTATTTTSVMSKSSNPELSIDIILNMESNESTPGLTKQNVSSGSVMSDCSNLNMNVANKVESKLPSFLRRISGGWADPHLGKLTKPKRGSMNEDALNLKSLKESLPLNIETDHKTDLKGSTSEDVLNKSILEISVKPGEKILSTMTDVDISILTKRLQPIDIVDEPDTVWEWNTLFTAVMAEINEANGPYNERKKFILKPDELPPLSSF